MRSGMVKTLRLGTAAAIAVGLFASGSDAEAAKKKRSRSATTATAPLLAGAASADITPPIGTPMFAYTDRSRVFDPTNNQDLLQVLADPDHGMYAKSFVPSKGFHTRLKTRALVIERRGVPYALAQVDLGGIPYAVTKAVAAKIADTGITQERLMISATHTHAGHGAIWPYEDNVAYGFVGGDVFDKRIFDLTVNGIADAIRRAWEEREAAKVGVGSTEVTDASNNRSTGPFSNNPEAGQISDKDTRLTVIRVDGAGGKRIAVWSNFAVHPTTVGDPVLSGDNPGATARIVEQAIGRGAVAVWTNGNEGDISPSTGPTSLGGEPAQYVNGSFAGSVMAGTKVARGVVRAWEAAGDHLQKDLEIEAAHGFLPFDGTKADGGQVGPVAVLGAGGILAPDATCAPVPDMAGPGQGNKMFLFGGAKIIPDVAPVSVWRIGDLGIVATPSEVTRTMGKRIRDAVAARSGGKVSGVIMAGLTDGYLSYTSTPEEYDACYYEGSFTLFGRQQGARYRDYLAGLAGHLFEGAPAPAGAPEPAQTGLGVAEDIVVKDTPDAGTAVTQPADTVKRFGRTTFRFKGGDRAVEAPRGQAWIRLQRRVSGEWKTVSTDDSLNDLVMRVGPETYEETYVFGECDPVGTYRFLVTGRARKNGVVGPYELASETFELEAAKLTADAPVVSGGVATVRARYPNPGADALTALPRLVTSGAAELLVNGVAVKAPADAATGTFTAAVPEGATVTLRSVTDRCGNAS